MKKNISINISGIIFHIEEDGYEQLRSYLDTITHYFSSYEDSSEIIADIESRIAEIFLAKLKEGRQVVTLADVKHLMTTMGSIHDFQAIEGDPIPEADDYSESTTDHTYQQGHKDSYGARKLYRDTKRRIIGGVAAGIAHYFRLDPLWIRLIMILLLFDIFITSSVGVFMFVGYIIGWIVIPPNDAVEEDLKTKKLYRNPEDRVISGVCSGLGTYFGVDVALVRLLFVLCLFISFGSFLLIYFILWVITPEAKTITDKIQMQGDPVTLANIESNIKQSLKIENEEEEGVLTKILLFPFRLIALIFSGFGKALSPFMLFLVEAIRIISGIIILIISVALLFSLLIVTGVYLNISGYYHLWIPQLSHFPMEILQKSFPPLLFASAFFTTFVPLFALFLAGVSIMVKRRIGGQLLGWSLLSIWLLAVTGLGLTLPVTIKNFSSEATYRITQTFAIDDAIMILDLKETGMDDYQATTLQLLGTQEEEYKLVQKFKAKGSSRQNALANAEMVSYHVDFNDSILIFDSNIKFKEDALFRVQALDMQFYIPYNKPFIIKENLKPILRNTLHQNGYSSKDLDGNIWMFTEDGLQCQTCPQKDKAQENRSPNQSTTHNGSVLSKNIVGFESLEVKGMLCEIIVTKQDNFSVELFADQSVLDKVSIEKNGSTLEIAQNSLNKGVQLNPRLKVVITMPHLEAIKLSGLTEAYVEGFDEESIDIILSGSNRSAFNLTANDINLILRGDAKLTLTGKANYMNAKISGASELTAENFAVENAAINANGVSNATINVSQSLEAKESGFSRIENKHEKEEKGNASTQEITAFYINNARIFYHTALAKASFWIKDPHPSAF